MIVVATQGDEKVAKDLLELPSIDVNLCRKVKQELLSLVIISQHVV